MIGQATASLEPPGRRFLFRLWGAPYIDTRQKWMAVWPFLKQLPEKGVRLLDAGCGTGQWSLELASRRPNWSVVGMDRDEKAIQVAETATTRLGLENVAFVRADFLEFQSVSRFDLVLSIVSSHYLVAAGKGEELFRRFRSWLVPTGRLVLLGPRRKSEVSFFSWLPRPVWHDVFSVEDLTQLCRAGDLGIEQLSGRIGRLGILAHQLDWIGEGSFRRFLLLCGLYAVEVGLSTADARCAAPARQPSLMWLLVGRPT